MSKTENSQQQTKAQATQEAIDRRYAPIECHVLACSRYAHFNALTESNEVRSLCKRHVSPYRSDPHCSVFEMFPEDV